MRVERGWDVSVCAGQVCECGYGVDVGVDVVVVLAWRDRGRRSGLWDCEIK